MHCLHHPIALACLCFVALWGSSLGVGALGVGATDIGATGVGAEDPPSILLIMADDVGIEGLGCYGGRSYRTPHLDRMASEGIRFTRAYAQPLCTPTRVQIMTGKYNHRNWKSFGVLDPSARTFGHLLQQAGYVTGIFGKWQLHSYDPPDLPGAELRRGSGMHPRSAGFDEYSLFHAEHTEVKGSRYANPTMLQGREGEPGSLQTYPGRYGADVWVEQIVDFFDRHQGKPTFAYYPMALPHWPFQPTPDSSGWDPRQPQPEDLRYAGDMIEYMDTAVGKLMRGLREKELEDSTLVLFYSDNGTHTQVVSELADGRKIRGGKATPQQTGIHVPLIARWPERIEPSVCDQLIDASDFLPTLMDIAGAVPSDIDTDGVSFAPTLLGRDGPTRDAAFFWYDPRPGWDKERFTREVFALNKTHKLFRDGRLFRLTERPLEEIIVDPLAMTEADERAEELLSRVIAEELSGVAEPPLVDAYGRPEIDLRKAPKDAAQTREITSELLSQGDEFVYGDPNVASHRLWIFNPAGLEADEQRPGVILIHGGGWGGRPESLAAQAVYLQRRGINAIVIDFRAPRDGLTPRDTLHDAKQAYRWIARHGARHHIDVDRMVVAGGSAGGHLSLALVTVELDPPSTPGSERVDDPTDPLVQHPPKGMVLFNPVIDLVDGWEGGRRMCEEAGIDPRQFSPAHQVRRGLPPTLILSGSADKLIPPDMVRQFQRRMIDAGNQCAFVEYAGAGHAFFNYGRNDNRYFHLTMWEMEQFLEGVGF